MNPRRTVTTRQAALTFAGVLGALILILVLQHPEIFLWVLIIGGFVGCALWITHLYEQRDKAYRQYVDEVFAAVGLKRKNKLLAAVNVRLLDDNTQLAADNAAIVKRLAEVLDEHASCPAPVAVDR
jgi:hypothetical protein